MRCRNLEARQFPLPCSQSLHLLWPGTPGGGRLSAAVEAKDALLCELIAEAASNSMLANPSPSPDDLRPLKRSESKG